MRGWSLVLLGLGGLLLVAAATTAQQAEANLELVAHGPTEALQPNGQPRVVTVDWAYSPGAANEAAVRATGGGFTLAWNPSPSCAAVGLIVTGPGKTTGAMTPVPQETYRGTQEFSIVATQEAPGETGVDCHIGGEVASLNSQGSDASASASFQATVGYYGLVSSNVAKTQAEAGPSGLITYEVELTNNGNARTNVVFEAHDVPDGWHVEVPKDVLLESAAQGGTATARVVQIVVTVPESGGWNNREATFRIVATPTSTVTGEEASHNIQVNLLSRVRGWSWAWPAPLFPVVLVAVVAALVVVVPRLLRKKPTPAKTRVLRPGAV